LKGLVLAGATQTVITVAFLLKLYQKFLDEAYNFRLRGKTIVGKFVEISQSRTKQNILSNFTAIGKYFVVTFSIQGIMLTQQQVKQFFKGQILFHIFASNASLGIEEANREDVTCWTVLLHRLVKNDQILQH
jgi:hypothetical protein